MDTKLMASQRRVTLSPAGKLCPSCFCRESVTSVIVAVMRMTFYPFKLDRVFALKRVKLFPKIAILNRLFAGKALDRSYP